MLSALKGLIETSVAAIGTSSELSERHTIVGREAVYFILLLRTFKFCLVVGCIGMYALYRRLLPASQEPDSRLHRTVWAVQKTVPAVIKRLLLSLAVLHF